MAEAEVRSIDLWNIRFEADRSLYLEDDIPAALNIKELQGSSTSALTCLAEFLPYKHHSTAVRGSFTACRLGTQIGKHDLLIR